MNILHEYQRRAQAATQILLQRKRQKLEGGFDYENQGLKGSTGMSTSLDSEGAQKKGTIGIGRAHSDSETGIDTAAMVRYFVFHLSKAESDS